MLRFLTLACTAGLLTAACGERAETDMTPPPDPAPAAESPAETPDAAPDAASGPLSDDFADLLPLRGFGHEPNWHVRVEAETTTIYRQIDPLVSFPTRQPDDAPARLRFDDPDGSAHVEFERDICRDIATGMPHPYTVSAQAGDEAFTGCGGDAETLFADANWALALLGEEPLASDRELSIRFEDGRVSGSSGCNRFMGGYTLTGESLTLSEMASTQMACPDDAMAQELRILERLAEVTMFDLTDEGALVLRTGPGETITAYRTE
jgi:heat shock protein HslJ